MNENNTNSVPDINYDDEDIIDIGEWIDIFWTNRNLFAIVICISLVIGVIVALLFPKEYTATATILPPQVAESKTSSVLSSVGGIAGDILGTGDVMSKVYPDIAKSRNVLMRVLDAPYGTTTFRGTLQNNFKFEKNIDDKLIAALQKNIVSASIEIKTSVVSVSVTYTDPVVAAALVNETLNQMDVFFKYSFRSVASSQRTMIEQRLVEVSDSLKIAEDTLLQFRESNRTTALSPKLQLSEARLLREVEINNTLYLELSRQHEVAKISELQLKPIVNVLDVAVPPIKKSKPSRRAIVLIFGAIGFFSTLVYLKVYPKFLQYRTSR